MSERLKELISITVNLTVVCFFAGAVLGATYLGTQHAKEQNLAKRETHLRLSLLGLGADKAAPAGLKMESIRRFLVHTEGEPLMAYLTYRGADASRYLVLFTMDGQERGVIQSGGIAEAGDISQHLAGILPQQLKVTRVQPLEDYLVALKDGQVVGYLLSGSTLGFKAAIRLMVALNPDLSVRGVAIIESEEDPGLGAETSEPYFKNQFVGKDAQEVAKLTVTTKPLPEEYRRILESDPNGNFGPQDMEEVKKSFSHSPIYAVTGATISSSAVTRGVQRVVNRFAYRLQLVQKALAASGHPLQGS